MIKAQELFKNQIHFSDNENISNCSNYPNLQTEFASKIAGKSVVYFSDFQKGNVDFENNLFNKIILLNYTFVIRIINFIENFL